MLLPAGRLHDGRNGCALRTLEQRKHFGLLRLAMIGLRRLVRSFVPLMLSTGDRTHRHFGCVSSRLVGGLGFLGLLWRATVNSDGRKASLGNAQRPRPRGHSALIDNITC
jgi:hypothetical protein